MQNIGEGGPNAPLRSLRTFMTRVLLNTVTS